MKKCKHKFVFSHTEKVCEQRERYVSINLDIPIPYSQDVCICEKCGKTKRTKIKEGEYNAVAS